MLVEPRAEWLSLELSGSPLLVEPRAEWQCSPTLVEPRAEWGGAEA
jgi:hypothetical protein